MLSNFQFLPVVPKLGISYLLATMINVYNLSNLFSRETVIALSVYSWNLEPLSKSYNRINILNLGDTSDGKKKIVLYVSGNVNF